MGRPGREKGDTSSLWLGASATAGKETLITSVAIVAGYLL